MDFVDWLKFGLALLLVVIGLIVLGAWAIFRAIDMEEEDGRR